jgi:hypothetical protein
MQNFTHFTSRIPAGILLGRGAAVTVLWLICLPSFGQTVPDDVKKSFRIVSDLADQIKGCSPSLYAEERWGTKPNEVQRQYLDHPYNVIWDGSKRENTFRAPYQAYIEFSSHYFERVPPETKAKYDSLERIPNFSHLGEWKFRYEFDVSPDTVKFTRAFVFYPGGGGSSEPFNRTDMCWDRLLRQDGTFHGNKK